MRIPLIIDSNPDIDNFFAIMLINRKQFIEPKIISVVNGNIDIDKSYRNARIISKLLRLEVPIVRQKEDLSSQPEIFKQFGEDGFFDHSKDFSEKFLKVEEDTDNLDEIYKVIKNEKQKVKILSTSNLCNLKKLFRKYPEIISKVEEIVINEKYFDYNIIDGKVTIETDLDIDSIKMLTSASIKVTILSKELINKTKISKNTLNQIANINTELSSLSYDMLKKLYKENYNLEDILEALSLSNPEYFTGNISSFEVIFKRLNGDIIKVKEKQMMFYLTNINQLKYEEEVLKMFS